MARLARLGGRRRRPGPGALPAGPAHGAGARAGRRRARDGDAPTTSTPSRPSRSRGSRATRSSSAASAPYIRWNAMAMVDRANHRFDGARRPPLHVRLGGRRSTTSASTTSSGARATAASATRSSSRATPRPACTPGRSSRAASPRSSSTGSGARSTAAGSRATRTRGACPTSGSSRPCRWASARSTRSTRPGSTATCCTARSSTPARSKVWCFVGDGEMDEPESMAGAVDRGARAARQPDLRRQLQPAAPRRPGARQRQDHPGARGDLPRRGLERDQGDLGPRLGRAARSATSTACSSTR